MVLSNAFYNVIEWIAAAAGLINCYLLTRQTIWAWPTGLLCVFLYTFVFYHNHLYSDVILNMIYVVLNIYGWYRWGYASDTSAIQLPVSRLLNRQVILLISLIIPSFILWGYFIGHTTTASFVYPDAFILVTSLCAQYLLAIKKIENWILWIVVDLVAIIIYFLKGLYVTSGLYSIYIILCILGLIQWQRSLRLHSVST